MDEKLKVLCREVADILRKEYNPDAAIVIKGNCSFKVVYDGLLLKENEDAKDLLKYR